MKKKKFFLIFIFILIIVAGKIFSDQPGGCASNQTGSGELVYDLYCEYYESGAFKTIRCSGAGEQPCCCDKSLF